MFGMGLRVILRHSALRIGRFTLSTRREFLEGCAAAAGVSATFPFGTGLGQDGIDYSGLQPQLAIFDRDFVEARSFARAVRARGIATHAISGDVTSLWYDDLYFRWREGSVVMAGLTGRSALFCLEQLAWDAGHRVLLRVNHTQTSAVVVEHAIHGPEELVSSAGQLLAHCENWGARMANLVLQCPRSGCKSASLALAETPTPASPWSEPLASWVIAPKFRA